MTPQHPIIIDTDHLTGVAKPERDWLETWLHVSKKTRDKNIVTVMCGSAMEVMRVRVMLTNHGLPPGAILRGSA